MKRSKLILNLALGSRQKESPILIAEKSKIENEEKVSSFDESLNEIVGEIVELHRNGFKTTIPTYEESCFGSDDSFQDPDYEPDNTNKSNFGNNIKQVRNLIMEDASNFQPVGFFGSNNNIANVCEEQSITVPHFIQQKAQSTVQCEESGITLKPHSTTHTDAVQSKGQETVQAAEAKDSRSSRKRKRNIGKSYATSSGKIIKARSFKALETCRMKCKDKICLEDQTKIFHQYWELGSYALRHAFVCGLISVADTKTHRKNEKNLRNRTFVNKYCLIRNGLKTEVCQKCFRYTLCESEQFIKTVVKKKLESSGTVTCPDDRGKHEPANKLSLDVGNKIRDHINSFPAYESHYTRRDTSKKYLHSDLTLATMYRLYCSHETKPVSLTKYCQIFHSMGLKFKKPKLDTCNTCEKLKAKIEISTSSVDVSLIKEEQKKHHEDADKAYKTKENDKLFAKDDSSNKVYSFDLQQCLPTPLLRTQESFYKRQLWTFNLTVHDCVTGQPICYMWHESIAKRGGNEIASCIFKHLLSVPMQTKHAIFYSDCCAGQNKNSYMSVMFQIWMQMEQNHLDIIDHKFLVSGHTHMECDVDHALIEKYKKKTNVKIHHPHDWYQLVSTVGVKHPFIVEKMTNEDIYDFASATKNKFTWRKVDEEKNKFNWQKVRWLRYERSKFGVVLYKNSFDDNEVFKILNIKKRGVNSVTFEDVSRCYTEPIPISKEKKKDLLDVLSLINPDFHSFYKSLPVEGNVNVHPDLVETDEE